MTLKNLGLTLFLFLLLGLYATQAQGDKFTIQGRLKVDGGSNSDAKIIVEKDGRQVKVIEGQAKFDIALDFQSIYVLSFVKEGFVTKRLRFDTSVPKERIEFGFEPFSFQVEIFEQYDDVNMVVFNQPVGKIAYSEIIDEFDYDTDYTKTIQSQLDQAQKDVEEAKERKEEQAAKATAEVNKLTAAATSAAKSGDYNTAITKLEEAKKLKDDPVITEQITTYKKAQEEQKVKDSFNEIVKQAEAAMAAGDLENAKKLFQQANGVMENDPKVKAQLAKIEEENTKKAQQQQAFEQASAKAKQALDAGNLEQAIANADEALKIKQDPALEALKAKAIQSQQEKAAKEAEAASKEKAYQSLVAEGDKAFKSNDFNLAKSKFEEAKTLLAKPELEEKLRSVTDAIAKLEEESKAKQQAAAALEEAIKAAEKAVALGDLALAKTTLDKARTLGEDDRIQQIAQAIAGEEARLAAKAKEEEAKSKQVEETLNTASKALADGNLEQAKKAYNDALSMGADEKRVKDGLSKIEAAEKELADAKAKQAADEAAKVARVNALIEEAKSAIERDDLSTAKSKLDEVTALGNDARVADLYKEINRKESDLLKAEKDTEALNKAYTDAMAEGNKALSDKNVDAALKAFNKALSLKPDEQAPKDGLQSAEEIKKALEQDKASKALAEEQEARKAKYNDLVAAGESALQAEELTKAEEKFNEALGYSDDPVKAKEGLSEVAKRKSAMSDAQAKAEAAAAEKAKAAELEQQFTNYVKQGDEALASDKLDQSKGAYEQALALKADEAVTAKLEKVKQRIDENQRNAEQAALAKQQQEAAERANMEAAERKRIEDEEKLKQDEAARLKAAQDEASVQAAKALEAQRKLEYENEMKTGNQLLGANKLKESKVAFQRALKVFPGDEQALTKIREVEEREEALAKATEKNKEAAIAITDNRGRESDQLAKIIEEEATKTVTKPDPKDVKMATGVMEQEIRPGSSLVSPVVISDLKVGDAALSSNAAKLGEEEIYDGIQKRSAEEQKLLEFDKAQKRLLEKYQARRTVETEREGNAVVTYVYINYGEFVTVYKKVEHAWGGVFYFVDGRATNQRFWDHETQ